MKFLLMEENFDDCFPTKYWNNYRKKVSSQEGKIQKILKENARLLTKKQNSWNMIPSVSEKMKL